MKTKPIFMLFVVSVLAIFLVSLLSISVAAVDSISFTEVGIDGTDVTDEEGVIVLARGLDNEVEIRVELESDADLNDVQLEAVIRRYSVDDLIEDHTDTFDMDTGISYVKKLNLKLPLDMDADTYSLRIRAEYRSGEAFQKDYLVSIAESATGPVYSDDRHQVRDTLERFYWRIYTLGDDDYKISVFKVNNERAELIMGNERTVPLATGESHTFSDGSTLLVLTAHEDEGTEEGDASYVTFLFTIQDDPHEDHIVTVTASVDTGYAPLTVDFTCDITCDDETHTYFWDFGDGSHVWAQNPTHTYDQPGEYYAECSVYGDQCGCTDNGGTIVVVDPVQNNPPVADFMWTPPAPKVGEVVTFTTLATDPDNDIVLHEWDLNDDGIFEHYGMSGDFVFTQAGSYPVTHKVTDATGLTNQVTKTVVVKSNSVPEEPQPSEPEPQSKAGWSSFRILNEEGLGPGDTMLVLVTVDNNGDKKMENARLTLLSYGLDVRDRIGPFDLRPGKMFSTIMYLDIPEYAPEGLYDLRAVLSSEDGVKRVKHRDFFINGPEE